jgi:hypothetical protein
MQIIKKHHKKALFVLAIALILLSSFVVFSKALATQCPSAPCDPTSPTTPAPTSCPAGQAKATDTGKCEPLKRKIDCHSGQIDNNDPTKCEPLGNDCNGKSNADCLKDNPITAYLNNIVDLLSAGVVLVVIGTIIFGGIQYAAAGGNATAVQAAKQRIINGLIALFAFLFLFAFLQWLIPGGL